MNRRQTKKEFKKLLVGVKQLERKEDDASLYAEMSRLVYLVNTQTNYCVFVRFNGHVDSFDLDIAESKKDYNPKLTQNTIGFGDNWDAKRYVENIKRVIQNLKFILEHNMFPDELGYETVEKRLYRL